MDLWCVVNGIKLTWLVDYLPLDITKMLQLLEDSKSAGIFTIQDHSLVILLLNSDVLVMNTAAVAKLASPPAIVDVSRKLHEPVIMSECAWESVTCAIHSIYSAIADKSCDEQLPIVRLTLADDVNLCTVFGWLLGYPVVYWFDSSSPNSCECVSVKRLFCYSTIVSNASVSITQFTYI